MIKKRSENCLNTFPKKEENKKISNPEVEIPKKFNSVNSGISQSPSEKKLEQTHKVIEYVKNNNGQSLYTIAKELNIPNSTLFYIIKDLESSNVIFTKMELTSQNRAIRCVYYTNKSGETNNGRNNEP